MSKKGVTAEEKKSRMIELFYETGECYQLKELEKLAPKAKGIVANSVKDVVQKLVDDGLIDSDKIGTSIYYWSFPSKGINLRKRKLNDITAKYEKTAKQQKLMNDTLQDPEMTEDQDKLSQILSEITGMELDLAMLKKKLQDYRENDPVKFDSLKVKTLSLKNAANRWTDNVFAVKSWCKNKFLIEEKVLNKQFGIPEDFDYIE